MGIHSRDYFQDDSNYGQGPSEQPMTVRLIIITCICFVIQLVFAREQFVEPYFSLVPEYVLNYGFLWQFVTYAFLHSINEPFHIIFNMVVLWSLGQAVEQSIGRREFLWFYLISAIFAGACQVGLSLALNQNMFILGASGAVLAVVARFAIQNPYRTLMIWGVFPVQARWLLLGIVLIDLFPLIASISDGRMMGNIANAAHLGGVLFGVLHFKQRWNLSQMIARLTRFQLPFSLKRKPKLKVHRPDAAEDEPSLQQEMDRILEKIHREGEEKLTKKERETLTRASEYFKNRNRPGEPV